MNTKIICLHDIPIYRFTQINCDSLIIMVDKSIGDHSFADSKYLQNVSIYGNNTVLGLGAFSYCSNIQSAQMYNVSAIGEGAFTWCEKLENISLDVSILEKGAFFQCKSLKEVVFSEKLELLSERSFFGCDNLNKVIFLGKPPVMDGVFEFIRDDLGIYIKREYKSLICSCMNENIINKHIVFMD